MAAIAGLTACGGKATEQTDTAAAGTTVADTAAADAQAATGDDTRKNFVFGDYVGNVDPASGAYAWVGMRVGVMESLFKFDENLNVEKTW